MSHRNDLNQSGIPTYGKIGNVLTQTERMEYAKKRGLCFPCGIPIRKVSVFGSSKPLSNEDVYQGICIKCNGTQVPVPIWKDWQARNIHAAPIQPVTRFKAAVGATMIATNNNHHQHPQQQQQIPQPPRAGLSSPGPATGHSARLRSPRAYPKNPIDHQSPGATNEKLPSSSSSMSLSLRSMRSSVGSLSSSTRSNVQNTSSHRQPDRNVSQSDESSATSGQSDQEDLFRTSSHADPLLALEGLKANKDIKRNLHIIRNATQPVTQNFIPELKAIMEKYRGDARIMMLSTGAVWATIVRDEIKKSDAEICIDAILDLIRMGVTKDDAELVQWALGTLASLSRDESNRRNILKKRGVEGILEAMKRHEKTSMVVEWGCRTLFTMIGAFDRESSEGLFEDEILRIQDYGGISVITAAMKINCTEMSTLCWCMKVLIAMLDRKDAQNSTIAAQMMFEEDITVVCTSILNSQVTTECWMECQDLLSALILCSANEPIRRSLLRCIAPICAFAIDHPMDIEIVNTAAAFFTAICQGVPEAKRQVRATPFLDVLLSTMIGALHSIEIQRNGATLLWMLSSLDLPFDLTFLALVKQALDAAMHKYVDDDTLSQAICGFVANISFRHKDHKDVMPIDLVMKLILDNHSGPQNMRALAAIVNAFPEVLNDVMFGKILVKLVKYFSDGSIDVQTSSAATLSSLMIVSSSARGKVLESGIVKEASERLKHADSEEHIQSLLQFIQTSVTGAVNTDLQLDRMIIQSILNAMHKHPLQKKIAFSTIRNVLLSTTPGALLDLNGLPEGILQVLGSSSNPDDVVKEACGVLWSYIVKSSSLDTESLHEMFRSLLKLMSSCKGQPNSTPYNGPLLEEATGALSALLLCIRGSPVHIAPEHIGIITSLFDVVIEFDVDNVMLIRRFLDITLTLCFLTKEMLIEFGVIFVVIDSMVEHESNEMVQETGCAILATLSSKEKLQVNLSIAETDGIDTIISALAGFPNNPRMQRDACQALSHLSIDGECRMLIVSQGGLILLVNAIRSYQEQNDLIDVACAALLNLSSDAEEQVLTGSNVASTIVSLMQKPALSNHSKIQEKCLGILQNMSMRNESLKHSIAEVGGVSATLHVIEDFMGNPNILDRAFTTLWTLALSEENQILIASKNGVTVVINGMMANITAERVQRQGCGCLCTLSANPLNKTLIRDLGGVDAIVYAMWAHYDSEGLLVEACRALSSLAVNVQTNEVMIASEGEITAIMSAMSRYPYSEIVQENACVALRNFLLSSDNVSVVRPQALKLEELVTTASTRFPEKCKSRKEQILSSFH